MPVKPPTSIPGAKKTEIGARLRRLRVQKGLSQGDIEKASGLLRCYTSRVENGHTVPSLETLERFAAALGVPLYQLFYSEEGAPADSAGLSHGIPEQAGPGNGRSDSDAEFISSLKSLLERIAECDRPVLLAVARKLASP